jgi:hypothetical protein
MLHLPAVSYRGEAHKVRISNWGQRTSRELGLENIGGIGVGERWEHWWAKRKLATLFDPAKGAMVQYALRMHAPASRKLQRDACAVIISSW